MMRTIKTSLNINSETPVNAGAKAYCHRDWIHTKPHNIRTTEEVIQQFIADVGDEAMSAEEVEQYFQNLGIELREILGSLFSTPGIHHLNGKVWYDNGVVKLPPNHPH